MTLFWCASGWIAGLALALRLALPPPILVGWAIAGATLSVVWWPRLGGRRLGLSLAFAALAMLHWAGSQPGGTGDLPALARYHGQTVSTVGWVSDEPVDLERHSRLRVTVETVAPAAGGEPTRATGDILVIARDADLRYGDRLALRGVPKSPPVFDGFSYRDYLARHGINTILTYPQLRTLPGEAGEPWRRALYDFRAALRAGIERVVPQPEAGLLVGVLLGSRSAMPRPLLDAFSATNTTHLLAISGWNITLVASWAGLAAGWLTRGRGPVAFLLIALALAAYTLLVGAAPSVMRAFLMGVIGLAAGYAGRPADVLPALGLAALVTTAVDPALILDVGWQLSFLATLGIVLFAGPLERRLTSGPRLALPLIVARPLSVTLAAELVTTPLLAYDFHRLSLIGLAANLALGWTMAPIMLFGAAAALLAWLPVPELLVAPAAWLAWLCSAVLIHGVEWFAALPLAVIEVGEVDPRLLGAWYALLGLWVLQREGVLAAPAGWLTARLGGMPRPARLWSGAWTLALIAVLLWPMEAAPDRLLFLFTGGGEAVLARESGGAVVLIDGGSTPDGAAGALGRRLPAWARRVDLLALNTLEAGRAAGLPEVARRYDIAAALLPAAVTASPLSSQLDDALRQRDVPRFPAEPGLALSIRDGRIVARVLAVSNPADPTASRTARGTSAATSGSPSRAANPGQGAQAAQAGAGIAALRLDVGALSALLLSDLSPDVQRAFAADPDARGVQVLSLPARGTLSPDLLATVNPRVLVLQPAAGRADGISPLDTLPDGALTGIEVWRAGPDGTIEVEAADGGLRVRRQG